MFASTCLLISILTVQNPAKPGAQSIVIENPVSGDMEVFYYESLEAMTKDLRNLKKRVNELDKQCTPK